MSDIEIRVTGVDEALRRMQWLIQHFPHEVAGEVYTEAELTMTESKRECPVDTGALRGSGFVEAPKITSNNISVTLGYGGVAAKVNPKTGQSANNYAIIVHEKVGGHWISPGIKEKFLEDPIKRRAPKILERVALKVKRLLEAMGRM